MRQSRKKQRAVDSALRKNLPSVRIPSVTNEEPMTKLTATNQQTREIRTYRVPAGLKPVTRTDNLGGRELLTHEDALREFYALEFPWIKG